MERPAILDVPMPDGRRRRVSVVLYDTKLLAPAGAGSLKALGELLGFPKLEVPPVVDEGGRTVAGITRMDIVASQHPDAFRAYAIRDAELPWTGSSRSPISPMSGASNGCRGRWPRWALPAYARTPRPNCRPSWAAA